MTVLSKALWFPDPEQAADDQEYDGLVAVGGDLSAPRLLLAYRHGIFPWTARPITWWSPDPRGVIEFDQFHISRSLKAVLRKGSFKTTVNRAFPEVMRGCAEAAPGRRHTWISRDFIAAYTELHRQGHAHSLECWSNGVLVGGVYGVSIGSLFAGESMFHRVSNASKVALCRLVDRLREREFTLFDIQMTTPITEQMGATSIPRSEYLRRLREAVEHPNRFDP